jgi:hypothetical protein
VIYSIAGWLTIPLMSLADHRPTWQWQTWVWHMTVSFRPYSGESTLSGRPPQHVCVAALMKLNGGFDPTRRLHRMVVG